MGVPKSPCLHNKRHLYGFSHLENSKVWARNCERRPQWWCSVAQSCLMLRDPMDRSTPGLPAHHQLPELAQTPVVMSSNHLILCHPLLLLPSIFPSIRVFSSELAFASGGQRTRASASASVLPMNIQAGLISFRIDWFDLLAVQGLSRVFSAPQFERINYLALSLLYGRTLTSIHDYWKNNSFDSMDLCQQSNVSDF